jgi:cytochrome P450
MTIISNQLDAIKFKPDFLYSKATPTFVSRNVSTLDEIARWVLDRNAILYKDEPHAPALRNSLFKRLTGSVEQNDPVLQMTDALIYSTDSVVLFWEQRCTTQNRLLSGNAEKDDEILDLYHLFTGEFFAAQVDRYMYKQLLANKKNARTVFKQRTPFIEKLLYDIGYPFLKKRIQNEFNLKEHNANDWLVEIEKVFAKVDGILSDGRRYLTGDTFTLADLSFAATAAPMILPVEFGGVLPTISQMPDEYREAVYKLRETAAGQFVLRLYQEDRQWMLPQTAIPKEPNLVSKLITRLIIALGKKKYKLFYFLQKTFPVLKIPFVKVVLVNKNDLLVEMLTRDEDFTIEEINSKKMADQKGTFFLGMDRNNPQFNRERDFVRKATKRDDLEMIRNFIRESTTKIMANADRYKKLDVANSYCKVVLVRLLDYYFGVNAPTETDMKEWLRVMFFDLFLNFTNNTKKHAAAVKAADERKAWLIKIINQRKQELKEGKTLKDNLLNRLIIMQSEPGNEWVDMDVLQRNIGGLMTGILETTNKSVILVLDELFNRPETLKEAIAVAQSEDMTKMYGYVSEALRFNPTQPGVIRYTETERILSGKNKTYTIPAKRKVMALTASAMSDPAVFPSPKKFIGDRDTTYMNYGFALHECYGKYINAVTLSEFTAAVLRLKNVRRGEGRVGRGTGINQESFPNNFVVQFD